MLNGDCSKFPIPSKELPNTDLYDKYRLDESSGEEKNVENSPWHTGELVVPVPVQGTEMY